MATTSAELKHAVCDAVDALRPEIISISRAIHAEPELAFQEEKAAARLAGAVERHDLAVARGAYGLKTAFASEFGPEQAPRVAILSEYDALPEIGHACGHNLIATAGLGAALALAKLGGRLPGRVRYLGTPAEESGSGKELMAREGAFKGVDAAMMMHPGDYNRVDGRVLACATIEVTYHGKAAHASSRPWHGINALDGLVLAYQSIAALRQHIKATERVHGVITDGGMAPNIVPERAAGRFFVRAETAKDLAALRERVIACFEAGAKATGARLELVSPEPDSLDMVHSLPLAHAFQANAESLGRVFITRDHPAYARAGSTDMGNVSHYVPSIHPNLASAPPECVIHNPEFARWAGSEMGDQAAIDGAKALAMTAIDFFTDAALRSEVKTAFDATKA
ncbi:MAG TPA: M20 family metallopeptidase [Dongiaceae bacterium]|nr:M20 family metallopeptidase [Dongiaceae bacterium]